MSGIPGIGTSKAAVAREVLCNPGGKLVAHKGVIVDGSKSRDTLNTGYLDTLRAGLLLGKITSGGKYAPAIIGKLADDYDATADTTTMTVTAATAVELVRRVGASGTFKLTGPPSAGGTVQTVTVTYSAVNVTTGVVTITALSAGVDEVQTITFDAAMTGGVLAITYYTPAGEPVEVTTPWDTNWATTMAAWNVASVAAATAVMGEASNGAVMTGTATVPILTYSGVGFTANPIQTADVDVDSTTGPEYATVAETTAGVTATGNDFINGALVQPTDGSETIMGLLGNPWGLKVTDDDGVNIDAHLDTLIMGGQVNTDVVLYYPTDTSLIAWMKAQLRAKGLGYVFCDDL